MEIGEYAKLPRSRSGRCDYEPDPVVELDEVAAKDPDNL